MLDTPYYTKLPKDCKIAHCRNSYVKEPLCYELLRGQEVKTYVVTMESGQNRMRVRSPNLPV